jgi:putative toxin-antitoxin system antitoxin component (TIGR02293 family)
MPRPTFKAPAEKRPAPSVQEAARVLGLRRVPANELELADMAREGLPSATLSRLSGFLGWTQAALIEQLGIAPRTAARRLTRREPLSTAESERVLRLARVLTRAIDVFESQDAAKQWLQEPSTALGERKPIDLLATDIGTEVVLNELGKIDHGFFA